MAQFKNYDRARNACSTEGLGALTIGDALTPGNSIKARMSTGDTAKFYYIKSPSQWISFLGTFTSPDQLARTRIIDGSSGPGVNVDFGAGAGEIGMDVPAEDLDALNLIPVPVTSAATTDIGALYGKIVAINGTTGPVTSYGATTINKERWVVHNGEQINHSAAIALIGSVNYLSSAGDVSFMKQDASSNWKEYVRTYADGRGPDGSVALPRYSFTNDPDSGLWRIGANNLGVSVNGANVLGIATTGASVVGLLDLSGATSGQVKFPATQVPSANANTLDDYEEFTWTPTLVGDGVAGSHTYAYQYGYGIKIGRLVVLTGFVGLSAKDAAMTGGVYIGGCPFTGLSDLTVARQSGFCGEWVNLAASKLWVGLMVQQGSAAIYLPTLAAAATGTALMQPADLGNTSAFGFTIAMIVTG